MTHKYERHCWYCGSKDLEPTDYGVKCRSCGATWNKVPQVGQDPVTYDTGEDTGVLLKGELGYPHPSDSVLRGAARERDKATPK